MSSDPAGSGSSAYVRPSANDRFKRRWSRSVVGATLLGVVFHFVILFGTPQMRVETTAEKRAAPAQLLRLVNLPAFSLPRVSEVVIVAPELPTVEELDLDLRPEIVVPEFSESLLSEEGIRPPIRRAQDQWLDYKQFAPYVVRPEIRNRGELVRFLQRSYQFMACSFFGHFRERFGQSLFRPVNVLQLIHEQLMELRVFHFRTWLPAAVFLCSGTILPGGSCSPTFGCRRAWSQQKSSIAALRADW